MAAVTARHGLFRSTNLRDDTGGPGRTIVLIHG